MRKLPGADGPALFLSLKGQRLSARAVDLAVRRLGRAADVTLSAHTLRHTCLTGLVRAGHDNVLVAELAGHSRLEATRWYSLPRDGPAGRHGQPRRRLLRGLAARAGEVPRANLRNRGTAAAARSRRSGRSSRRTNA